MGGMREFQWHLIIKSFYVAMGSRKLILTSPTMNTCSDLEVNHQIPLNFILNC